MGEKNKNRIEKFLKKCEEVNGLIITEKDGFIHNYERVALLISHDLNLEGAQLALLNMAKAMRLQGIDPIIMSPLDGPMRKDLHANSIPLVIIHGLLRQDEIRGDYCGSNEEAHIYNRNLNDLIKSIINTFDLVVANTIVTSPIVCELNGTDIPLIWWVHEAELAYSEGVLINMPKYICSNVSLLTAGPRAKQTLMDYRPLYSNVEELLYSIPEMEQKITGCGQIEEIDKHKKTIFALIGTIQSRKGQDILLEAVRRLIRNGKAGCCCFIYVGREIDATLAGEIKREAAMFPSIIKYIPFIDRDKMPAFFSKIDCLVCASRDDPMPMVVAEACQFSKCIICSNNTGSADLIRESNAGMVYFEDDVIALLGCLKIA